jgi:hypothetical protein
MFLPLLSPPPQPELTHRLSFTDRRRWKFALLRERKRRYPRRDRRRSGPLPRERNDRAVLPQAGEGRGWTVGVCEECGGRGGVSGFVVWQ